MIEKQTLDDLTKWITEEVKLPIHADRELQLTALLSATMTGLTRIGPKTTRRALEWIFSRYGIVATIYSVDDRRPRAPLPSPTPEVIAPAPASACPECGREFATVYGLRGHSRVHKRRVAS